MVLLRLSPNEEARLLKEEREKRRKLRILQVREQSKQLAARTRQSVQQVQKVEYEKLAQQLQQEWEEKKAAREKFLEEMYLNSVKSLGAAHSSAKNETQHMDHISKRERDLARKHFRTAAQRHNQALSQHRLEEALRVQKENEHIFAREKALAIEKERAALVAALPTPEDPLASNAASSLIERADPIPVVDFNGQQTVQYQQSTGFAQREDEPMDAREDAAREYAMNVEALEAEIAAKHEQRETARLRGIAALEQVRLGNEYDKLCRQLESMKQRDLNRRQQNVAKISRNIFLPPHRRDEERKETQNAMESAFENIYMSQPGVSEHLQLSGIAEEAEDSQSENSIVFPTQANPLVGQVGEDAAENRSKHQDEALTKLMQRINQQREQISRVTAQQNSQSFRAVDDSLEASSAASGIAHASGDSTVNQIQTIRQENGGQVTENPVVVEFEPEEKPEEPRPSIPSPEPMACDEAAAASKGLGKEKGWGDRRDPDTPRFDTPCRDTDEFPQRGDSHGERILSGGPDLDIRSLRDSMVQVGSPLRRPFYTRLSDDSRNESCQRDKSPVAKYLEGIQSRDLSTTSIEENLARIRERNQQLMARQVKPRRPKPIRASDTSRTSEESVPTQDVGPSPIAFRDRADVSPSVGRDTPPRTTPMRRYVSSVRNRPGDDSRDSIQDDPDYRIGGDSAAQFASSSLRLSERAPYNAGADVYLKRHLDGIPGTVPREYSGINMDNYYSTSSDTEIDVAAYSSKFAGRLATKHAYLDLPSSDSETSEAASLRNGAVDVGRDVYSYYNRSLDPDLQNFSSGRLFGMSNSQRMPQQNFFVGDLDTLPLRERALLDESRSSTSSHGDVTGLGWLVSKYQELEKRYLLESPTEQSATCQYLTKAFPVEELSLTDVSDNESRAFSVAGQTRSRELTFEQSWNQSPAAYGREPQSADIRQEHEASAHTLSSLFSGIEGANESRSADPVRLARSTEPSSELDDSYARLPPVIEIRGGGATPRSRDQSIQDFTLVSPLPTPQNVSFNKSVDVTRSVGASPALAERTQPFTPESAIDTSPQHHSTPNDAREASVNDTANASVVSNDSVRSFTVLDADGSITQVPIDERSTIEDSHDSQNISLPPASLEEHPNMSPLSNTLSTEPSVSVTPESVYLPAGSLHFTRSSSSTVSDVTSGDSINQSVSPQVDHESTLTEASISPDTTPTRAKPTVSSKFTPDLPTIVSVDLDSDMSESSSAQLHDKLEKLDHQLSQYVIESDASHDTLDASAPLKMTNVPSSLPPQIPESCNSTMTSTSTLAVLPERSSGELSAVAPHVSGISLREYPIPQENQSGFESDTTKSSLGILDLSAVNTDLTDPSLWRENSKSQALPETGGGDAVQNVSIVDAKPGDEGSESPQNAEMGGGDAATAGCSVEDDRSSSLDHQRALEALKDFDISGIDVIPPGQSRSLESSMCLPETRNDSCSEIQQGHLSESLLSFRRHEEELLRTDISQDDMLLSLSSSSHRLVKSAIRCSGSGGGEALDNVSEEEKDKPSLQDVFNSRMSKFIENSQKRQQQVQQAAISPKQVVLNRWNKQQQSKGGKATKCSGGVAKPSLSVQKDRNDRAKDEVTNKARTKKLYNQLEEVKQANDARSKAAIAAENRRKAQEYSKKIKSVKSSSSK